jgi:hypothetical protein
MSYSSLELETEVVTLSETLVLSPTVPHGVTVKMTAVDQVYFQYMDFVKKFTKYKTIFEHVIQ